MNSLLKSVFCIALVAVLAAGVAAFLAPSADALPQYCDYFVDCASPLEPGCYVFLDQWTCDVAPETSEQATYSLARCPGPYTCKY